MTRVIPTSVFLLAWWVAARGALAETARDMPRQTLIVVVGAAGEDAYGQQFRESADRLQALAEGGSVRVVRVGDGSSPYDNDLAWLESTLAEEPRQSPEPLWIVLIGHGTFDGRIARFNLRGPDLTAQQLHAWLAPFERTLVVVNCASASAPFLPALSGANRVVVTATRSGFQYNYARFAEFFAAALGDPQADLDKDGQTSLLEAFLVASARVAEFYRQEARLATEHALLDDNGDGRGTPPDWFRGVRAVPKSRDDAPVDGTRAHQLHLVRSPVEEDMSAPSRARRDALEHQLAQLRDDKPLRDENDYYRELLPIMIELAKLYAATDPGSP